MRRVSLVVIAMLSVLVGSLTARAGHQRPGADRAQTARTPHAAAAEPRTTPKPLRFLLVDAAGATVRGWPGGKVLGTMAQTTPLGSHSWAWAVSTTPRGRWARIVLPWRPNGRTGWIDLRGRSLVRTATWVRADLSKRTVTLLRGRRAVATFTAAIGASSTPTPTGKFSVTDLVATGQRVRPVRLVRVRAVRPSAQPAGRLGRRRPAGDPRHQRAELDRHRGVGRLPAACRPARCPC